MSLQPDSKKRKAPSSSSSSSVAPITTALLQKSLASLSSESFWDLISSSVLPHLNALPSSEINKIRCSFQRAIDARAHSRTINFTQRESQIRNKMSEFNQSVDEDGRDGWEDQGMIVSDILDLICPWVQDVFHVCVESKQELEEGSESLAAMVNALSDIRDSNTRCELDDMNPSLQIQRQSRDKSGNVEIAYTAYTISHSLAKTWRDLILVPLSTNQEDFAVETLHDAKHVDEFAGCVRKEDELEEENEEGDPFDDGWHSDEMKAALPRLRALLK